MFLSIYSCIYTIRRCAGDISLCLFLVDEKVDLVGVVVDGLVELGLLDLEVAYDAVDGLATRLPDDLDAPLWKVDFNK